MDNMNKKKILIVEDDVFNMKLVSDLLEFNGFEAIKAEDGPKALDILKTVLPDLILLDLQLPGIDGFEVLKQIRNNELTKKIKVIVMTASVTKEDEGRIEKAKFDGYIVKPINTREFVQKIKSILI